MVCTAICLRWVNTTMLLLLVRLNSLIALPRNLTLAWLSDQVSAASGSLVLVPTILLLPILLLLLLRPTHNNNSIFA